MTDVYFGVSADDAAAAGVRLPTLAELLGDERTLDGLLGGSGSATGIGAGAAHDAAAGAADASAASGDAAEEGMTDADLAEVLRMLTALSHNESMHAAMGG